MVDDFGYVSGRTVTDILEVQRELLSDYIAKRGKIDAGEGVITELQTGTGNKSEFSGRVTLDRNCLRVGDESYSLSKIRGFSNFLKRINEFNYENSIMRLKTEISSPLLLWGHIYFSHSGES